MGLRRVGRDFDRLLLSGKFLEILGRTILGVILPKMESSSGIIAILAERGQG
jgi:hypothetical protein